MAAATTPTTTISPLPSYIKVTKAPQTSAIRYELRFSTLYLHHRSRPDPNSTHETLLKPNGPIGFGATVANDWAIYDGPDPAVNALVARAQGLHFQTGNWSTIFNIIFEADGLKDSTLQVMGSGLHDGGDQWAILSGTGQFTMAQGFINKKLNAYVSDGTIIALDIYAEFKPARTNLITEGPKGGSEGQYREPSGVPYRLQSIKIQDSAVINSIQYTYLDQYGLEYTEGPWGGNASPYDNIIKLGADEFVKEVSGTIGQYNGSEVVTSLELVTNIRKNGVTNIRKYGPYGKASGNRFTYPEKAGGNIVGFNARTGEYVNAIGVVMRRP